MLAPDGEVSHLDKLKPFRQALRAEVVELVTEFSWSPGCAVRANLPDSLGGLANFAMVNVVVHSLLISFFLIVPISSISFISIGVKSQFLYIIIWRQCQGTRATSGSMPSEFDIIIGQP